MMHSCKHSSGDYSIALLHVFFSETRLLEIVEAACEKSDFECNQLLEQIEDQVETWWFHRYI